MRGVRPRCRSFRQICAAWANSCEAPERARWHHGAVDESEIQRLEALRAALKREWENLLRSEPAPSPLGNPDVLVYLMDETMNQVIAGLRQRPLEHWTQHARALRVPLHRHCECGFNPLLKYYATGEIALHVVVARAVAEHQEEILTCYHLYAQKEIDTLCAVCQQREAGHCKTGHHDNIATAGGGI